MKSDPWIAENSPLSPERLHAIGLITFRWNQCEFWLFLLFCKVSGIDQKDAWALVYDLGDIAICSRIKALLANRVFHADGVALILNALDAYDINRQNRNTVAHAWTAGQFDGEYVLARKSKKIDAIDPSAFKSDLASLRRVAHEIGLVETNLWVLCCIIEDNSISGPVTAPKRLVLPEALWKPAPQVHAKQKRLPQS
ncbi:hypothetical protein NKJ23_30075 [Mesorhizobium sp. M0184]|uniref:hypothetical protein n=1 Tax=Mesorhizobium sp. M0184 TaxID=2956906 RepID=UPI003337D640